MAVQVLGVIGSGANGMLITGHHPWCMQERVHILQT